MAKTRKQPKRSNLLLQTFWTGNPLSRLERAAIQSYINVGYTIDIYTYNPIAEFKRHVPASRYVRVHDAREILPESQLFQYSGRAGIGKRDDAYSYLPFSDLFRFTMLHKKGGAWVDLDIFMTRPIPARIINRPYVFSSERTIQKGAYRNEKPELVHIGFVKVPGPGSPLMSWILDHVPKPNEKGKGGLLDLKSPFDYMTLFRKGVAELDLQRYALPADAFLPLNWWDVKDSFAEGAGDAGVCYKGKYGTAPFCVDSLKRADVYGVHWFRAILRRKNLPYERPENRETQENLYEQMIAKIEDDAGLQRNSL